MTVDIVFQIINYIINKNLGQGDLTQNDFNNLANISQYEYLNYLLGDFQQYQPGRAVARVQFGMNQSVRQRLTPFIDAPSALAIDSTGLAVYPGNFEQMDAMYDQSMNRIRFIPQDKLWSYLKSQIDPISTNPIYLIESGGFRFYPNINYNGTAVIASLSYVHTPPNIKWASTTDILGRLVYDPGNSVDPEWLEVDIMEIIARILRKCGVNLQNQDVSRYADEIKQVGQ